MTKPFSAKMNFSGRVALVTTGTSSIGFAIASQRAELSAKTAIADINIDAAMAAADKLPNTSTSAAQVDVQERAEAVTMVDFVVEPHGKLDILIHGAGVGFEREFLETTEAEWRRLIDIDFIGTELVARMHSHETRIVYPAYVTGQALGVDGSFPAAGDMHTNRTQF